MGLTIYAFMDRSNVWYVYMMFAGPPAVLLTMALLAIGALPRRSDGQERRTGHAARLIDET